MSADESYPDDLRYHNEHDWARVDGDTVELGITRFAQHALGDVVFYDPPEVGATINANESYGELESVKAVSDVIAPLSGEVVEVNDDVVGRPESLNDDPYGSWLVRITMSDPSELDALLSASEYREQL